MLAVPMTMVLTHGPDPPLPPQSGASERDRDEAISTRGYYRASPMASKRSNKRRHLKDTTAVALRVCYWVSRIPFHRHQRNGVGEKEKNAIPQS